MEMSVVLPVQVKTNWPRLKFKTDQIGSKVEMSHVELKLTAETPAVQKSVDVELPTWSPYKHNEGFTHTVVEKMGFLPYDFGSFRKWCLLGSSLLQIVHSSLLIRVSDWGNTPALAPSLSSRKGFASSPLRHYEQSDSVSGELNSFLDFDVEAREENAREDELMKLIWCSSLQVRHINEWVSWMKVLFFNAGANCWWWVLQWLRVLAREVMRFCVFGLWFGFAGGEDEDGGDGACASSDNLRYGDGWLPARMAREEDDSVMGRRLLMVLTLVVTDFAMVLMVVNGDDGEIVTVAMLDDAHNNQRYLIKDIDEVFMSNQPNFKVNLFKRESEWLRVKETERSRLKETERQERHVSNVSLSVLQIHIETFWRPWDLSLEDTQCTSTDHIRTTRVTAEKIATLRAQQPPLELSASNRHGDNEGSRNGERSADTKLGGRGRREPTPKPLQTIRPISLLPFTMAIMQTLIPKKPPPTLERYNGSTDPNNHLRIFTNAVAFYTDSDPVICKAFSLSLRDEALEWYHTLPPNTKLFRKKYASNQKQEMTPAELVNTKQGKRNLEGIHPKAQHGQIDPHYGYPHYPHVCLRQIVREGSLCP
ncbi:hypothetical protein V8G54_004211 [Vigna mungo]|uniref:Retrotransposon gag domain-containing protein n=1 Tax=Vigna mungo TaxID=3915 RepID=A0AAQ3SCL3_VIGMU